MPLVQKVQMIYDWKYLLLGVDPVECTLRWAWADSMKQAELAPVLKDWDLDGVIWDGASSHLGGDVKALPLKRIHLPPYCPELNPAERVFEEIRRRVEGSTYATLEDKIAKTEAYLSELASDPERLSRLVGWDWIITTLTPEREAA